MKIGPFEIKFSKKQVPVQEVKNVDIDVSTPRGNYFFNLTDSDLARFMNAVWGQYSDSSLINIYHTMPEVFAPVHHIAFRVAQAKWQVRKTSNDEVVYDNKDLNRLLTAPNPLQNFQELIYEMVALKKVTGKNYLYLNIPSTLSFNYKNVATMVNLPADTVYIRPQSQYKILSATTISDLIQSYDVSIGSQTVAITPDKVIYTKHASLYANDLKLIGKSPLLSAQKAICNLLAVYEARNVIYTKRGALGFIVSRKQDADGMKALTAKEREQLLEDYGKTYGMTGTKSPVAITSLPIEYINVAMSIKDLEPFAETEMAAAAIFAVLNVPRTLMPRKEGATYENANQDEKTLYSNVVMPEAASIAISLTNSLRLRENGLYLFPSFEDVDVLQENKKEKSEVDWKNNETCRVRFLMGIITLNDWRVACGYEKVSNGLYDKLIYDMDDTQLQLVSTIINLSKNSSNDSGSKADSQKEG